jgi:hypothetical protein
VADFVEFKKGITMPTKIASTAMPPPIPLPVLHLVVGLEVPDQPIDPERHDHQKEASAGAAYLAARGMLQGAAGATAGTPTAYGAPGIGGLGGRFCGGVLI